MIWAVGRKLDRLTHEIDENVFVTSTLVSLALQYYVLI